jgi:hypothetical protein
MRTVQPTLLVNEPGDSAFVVLPDVENEADVEHAFEEVDLAVVVPAAADAAVEVLVSVVPRSLGLEMEMEFSCFPMEIVFQEQV